MKGDLTNLEAETSEEEEEEEDIPEEITPETKKG